MWHVIAASDNSFRSNQILQFQIYSYDFFGMLLHVQCMHMNVRCRIPTTYMHGAISNMHSLFLTLSYESNTRN